MGGLYIRVESRFFTHRKTLHLRRLLGDAALWLPIRLWTYAAENEPSGDFGRFDAITLADALHYQGDASSMLQALLDAGFMDRDPLRVHKWAEHNAYHQTYAERAKKAAMARWSKSPLPVPLPQGTEKEKGEREQASLSIAQACLKHPTHGDGTPCPPPVLTKGNGANTPTSTASLIVHDKELGDVKRRIERVLANRPLDEAEKIELRDLRAREKELKAMLGRKY